MSDLHKHRREYDHSSLQREQLLDNPFEQMKAWLAQATEAKLKDATAMTLATSDEHGQPDARIVLLKQLSDSSLSWYTHYDSAKGQQLAHNPKACLLFYWRDFDRQVRIHGTVEKLDASEADEYFHSRPLDSQFSAAASHQSQPIESREALEERVQTLRKHNPQHVDRPVDWGGYRLTPTSFEFWQGRENRLHDRFLYRYDDNGEWEIERLQP